MIRSPYFIGPVIGLLIAGSVLAVRASLAPEPEGVGRGAITADAVGALDEVVVHWTTDSEPVSGVALRAFLQSLDRSVTVRLVAPDDASVESFRRTVGDLGCQIVPLVVGHAMTGWSRDRWVALAPARPGAPVTLVAPRVEHGAGVWPARAGDARVVDDLAAGVEGVEALRMDLEFDGGDFVADDETVFVTPAVLSRNLGRTVRDRADLIDRLRSLLGRRVVLLDGAPDHHAGMFLMPIGDRRVMVGDPSLARPLVDASAPAFAGAGGLDMSPTTCARFDAVARACEAAGYDVIRTPVAPARDGRTWWTPLNAILETRGAVRRVWMPTFGDAAFDDASERVWRDAGYEVVRIDCSRAYTHFGSLRCLVNVLRRA